MSLAEVPSYGVPSFEGSILSDFSVVGGDKEAAYGGLQSQVMQQYGVVHGFVSCCGGAGSSVVVEDGFEGGAGGSFSSGDQDVGKAHGVFSGWGLEGLF